MDLRYQFAFTASNQRFELVDERIENIQPYANKSNPFFFYYYENNQPVINNSKNQKRVLRRSEPGHVYIDGRGDSGMIGVYKIETEVVTGTGRFERSGLGNSREAKENTLTAFNYFKANSKNISGVISTKTKDYLMYVQDIPISRLGFYESRWYHQ